MENAAHTLYGYAMSKAGLDRCTALATPTLLIAANLPDVDAISIFGGPESYFTHHRGFTHSLAGITVLSIVLSLLIFLYDKKIRLKRHADAKPVSFSGLLLISFLGTLSHLVLDFTNSYGVRPFLPWSSHWYYGDLAYIVDPWILLILFAGFLFSRGRPRASKISLALIAVYWIVLAAFHHAAVLNAECVYPSARISAIPTFANPFVWQIIGESPSTWITAKENLMKKEISPLGSFQKPNLGTILDKIAETKIGKNYLGFARFNQISMTEKSNQIDVSMRDLRFGVGAIFTLRPHDQILAEKFIRFRSMRPRRYSLQIGSPQ